MRCLLAAREIREQRCGQDEVDTATIYNNLGVLMFSFQRFREAQVYFELAEAILEFKLGAEHERTLAAAQNFRQTKKSATELEPKFAQLWTIGVLNPAPPKAGKKKKGKKKKR